MNSGEARNDRKGEGPQQEPAFHDRVGSKTFKAEMPRLRYLR